MFLLQQPEVHLHPSAQAALGSFWCEVGSWKRQLIVETHSDHLLDRVRMDVRDGRGRLKPDDVSILFFERDDLDVHIHSLRLDKRGNVLGAPASYRRFFMEETTRSLGF
jgi:predicted ATPase